MTITKETIRGEVLEAVRRLRAKGETVRLDDIQSELETSGISATNRDVDAALQHHRRAGRLTHVRKFDKRGRKAKAWGWLIGASK